MKPVDQEFLHDPKNGIVGDCLRACVASYLEVPIPEVPHFVTEVNWISALGSFLATKGLAPVVLDFNNMRNVLTDMDNPDQLFIFGGESPRGASFHHAVIGTFSRWDDFKLVHDPHPSKDGIVGDPTRIYLFVPLIKAPKAAI